MGAGWSGLLTRRCALCRGKGQCMCLHLSAHAATPPQVTTSQQQLGPSGTRSCDTLPGSHLYCLQPAIPLVSKGDERLRLPKSHGALQAAETLAAYVVRVGNTLASHDTCRPAGTPAGQATLISTFVLNEMAGLMHALLAAAASLERHCWQQHY